MITHIVNMSIRQGIIPDDIKRARVIPIRKKGCRTDPSMYRPISILMQFYFKSYGEGYTNSSHDSDSHFQRTHV